jgi:hypothetical protein
VSSITLELIAFATHPQPCDAILVIRLLEIGLEDAVACPAAMQIQGVLLIVGKPLLFHRLRKKSISDSHDLILR